MLITHTINSAGQRRIYLGGKASIEAWIEPRTDTNGWSFHLKEAPDAPTLAEADKKLWAQHILLKLATELDVEPATLSAVPFDTIAALHVGNQQQEFRRVRVPRSHQPENGFIARAPHETRPETNVRQHEHQTRRNRTF